MLWFTGEPDPVANAANAAAVVFHALPELNWAGFYFLRGSELVLGPFQGCPACVRIALGHGSSRDGMELAIDRRADVDAFRAHCLRLGITVGTGGATDHGDDCFSGVLISDSPMRGRFDDQDRAGCELLADVMLRHGIGKR